MLVLSRREGQKINIGNDVVVTVLSIGHGRVRVGIDAPQHVHVLRTELAEEYVSAPLEELHQDIPFLAGMVH